MQKNTPRISLWNRSAYCLFETFCPSDKTDEVLENALSWKEYAETLPDEFKEQVQRIWMLWTENRKALEPIYKTLPTSVFQADLNPSNILLDNSGKFVGIYDFNLCGKEVFLNYLFREIFESDFRQELDRIIKTLQTVSKYYHFSETEKNLALMLYRCIKPLWFNKLQKLKGLQNDMDAIKEHLNKTERTESTLSADVTIQGDNLIVTLTHSEYPDCPAETTFEFEPGQP